MAPSPRIGIDGVLSRCESDAGRIEVRVSPFVFDPDAAARPVWKLVFEGAAFDPAELQRLVETEVEIDVYDDKVVFYDVFAGAEHRCEAARVTADQVQYDDLDHRRYIQRLEAEVERLHASLRTVAQHNDQGRAIINELMRRAEIKAAASDHLHERQAAAIEVLKRLRAHFEGEPDLR